MGQDALQQVGNVTQRAAGAASVPDPRTIIEQEAATTRSESCSPRFGGNVVAQPHINPRGRFGCGSDELRRYRA